MHNTAILIHSAHLVKGRKLNVWKPCKHQNLTLGSLSRDVFERRTLIGSELFSLLVCLDANKFVLLSFFSPLKTIYSRVSTKPLPNDAKSSLPVDVRRSKTLLLKLPIGSCQHARSRAFSRHCRIILKTVTFSLMFTFAAHKKLKASVIADNYHQQHAASNTFVITRRCIAPAKVATASVCDHFFATKSLSN